ncbi:hypothetical protein QWY99_07225 [Flavobacterium branchiarum]|uniref:Uncharacterized protein n=1 Tax=Flavobacterium branchiarum TaxID=1114870 RepID=A0ABV5FRH4_9FLAO|nr:hypothetical protein [Flavobacterium branchiarum]MDN3672840.1 hypothetical protein [Flavobacterium branchiarum]
MIQINVKNKSKITVYDDRNIVYTMIRNTPLLSFKTYGEIFEGDNKIGKIQLGIFFKKQILYQSFFEKINIIKQQLYMTDFLIDENQIRIKNNPFFFFNKKIFSKIYFNSELIAIVSMRDILDLEGYNLDIKFLVENKQIEKYSVLCYLICCIEFNV